VSPKDLKTAKRAFERGLKLEKAKRLEEALDQFENASHLVPRDIDFATARELTRQELVYDHMQRGNGALSAGKEIEALAEFRSALKLDPDNHFAQQRMVDALGESAPKVASPPQVVADAGEIQVEPTSAHADFHIHGDSRDLLTQVAKAYGVTATIDESVQSRRIGFDIQDVDFYTAMRAAEDVTVRIITGSSTVWRHGPFMCQRIRRKNLMTLLMRCGRYSTSASFHRGRRAIRLRYARPSACWMRLRSFWRVSTGAGPR
jgi:tetratricopeptide (TPR) repeat protein